MIKISKLLCQTTSPSNNFNKVLSLIKNHFRRAYTGKLIPSSPSRLSSMGLVKFAKYAGRYNHIIHGVQDPISDQLAAFRIKLTDGNQLIGDVVQLQINGNLLYFYNMDPSVQGINMYDLIYAINSKGGVKDMIKKIDL